MRMQPVSREESPPLLLLSQQPSLRVVSPGTVDILEFIVDLSRHDLIGDLAEAHINTARDNVLRPGLLNPILAQAHADQPDEPRLHDAFDGTLADLADLSDDVLLHRTRPPAGFSPNGHLTDWVRRWMPLTEADLDKRVETTGRLERDLGLDAQRLSTLLSATRDDDEARLLLLEGKLGEALWLRRPFGNLDRQESIELVRGLARLFALIVACLRVGLLRRWDRTPLTDAFRHDCDHQYMARTLTSALVEPARDMLPVLSLNNGPDRIADLPAYLAHTRLGDPRIVALIESIAHRCFGLGSGRIGYDAAMARLQAEYHALIAPVAGVTPAQLREEKLGLRSFVEDRLSVTASFGTVIIAKSLLDAVCTIDSCVHATIAGAPLPTPTPMTFALAPGAISLRALKHTTDHLRRTIRPDRQSETLGERGLDNKAGFKMVDRALAAFQTCWPGYAAATLSIEPTVWF